MSIVEKAIGKHLQDRGPDSGKGGDRKRVRKTLPTQEHVVVAPPDEAPERPISPVDAPDVQIRKDELREKGVLAPEEMTAEISDQFRRIKRPLLANAFGKGVMPVERGNILMLSSALSGEGKTFSAINLAMSIALERDRTVLLVDADVAKPHISSIFGLKDKPGLLDLVLDETLDIGDVLVHTDIPGLNLLPAGSRHEHATELLASERMEELMDELAGRYPDRVIVVDSPPLLQTSEAQVLSGLVGQIVLVVQAGQTPQVAVQSALEMLDSEKAINLVLNKSRMSGSGDYYGGYYGQE